MFAHLAKHVLPPSAHNFIYSRLFSACPVRALTAEVYRSLSPEAQRKYQEEYTKYWYYRSRYKNDPNIHNTIGGHATTQATPLPSLYLIVPLVCLDQRAHEVLIQARIALRPEAQDRDIVSHNQSQSMSYTSLV